MQAIVESATGAILKLVADAATEDALAGTVARKWPAGLDPQGLYWPSGEAAPILNEDWRAAAALTDLRTLRGGKLAACDWTQLADAPLSNDVKAMWCAYRQALRDLPESVDPLDFEWPSPPAGG